MEHINAAGEVRGDIALLHKSIKLCCILPINTERECNGEGSFF